MSLPRSSASLLLGLAALAAAGAARAEPPVPPASEPPQPAQQGAPVTLGETPRPAVTTGETPKPPAQPAASGPHPREAMALHDQAWVLYEEGRYRAAIDRLESALRLDPEGRELVYNLALLHEKLANLREAIAYYRRYLEMESDPKVKARVQATLRRLEGAEREAAARPRGASGTLAAAPLPPPPPPLPPRRARPWVVATGSVSGAALVMGVAFGVRALTSNPGSSGRTGGGVTISELQADAHAAHTDAMVADLSFAVSAVAAGAALVLYYAAPRSAAAPPARGTPPGAARVALGPALLQVRF